MLKKFFRFLSQVLSLSEIKPQRRQKKHSPSVKKKGENQISVFSDVLILREKETKISELTNVSSSAELEQFLTEELRKYAQPLLDQYARKLGFSSVDLTIKPVKSMRWRCSRDNRILLNRDLIHLEKKIVEYVIVHEVAHLREKNHQKPFRELVKKLMPDYQIWQKALKKQIPISRMR